MNLYNITVGLAGLLLCSCSGGKSDQHTPEEDKVAKEMLQGVWYDDDTEQPLLEIKGDSIFYADRNNIPVSFYVIKDTIYILGKDTAQYKIDRQTEDMFWFHSLSDEVVKIHKAEEGEDNWNFDESQAQTDIKREEVVKKDSIVFYNNIRYRGYVYINPTQMKVYRSSYSENGYKVENVYYDNIIHACIYKGTELLFGKDFYKSDFKELFPNEFLSQAILADMNFIGVNHDGYQYEAILKMPDSAIFGCVKVSIGFDKKIKMSIKK